MRKGKHVTLEVKDATMGSRSTKKKPIEIDVSSLIDDDVLDAIVEKIFKSIDEGTEGGE